MSRYVRIQNDCCIFFLTKRIRKLNAKFRRWANVSRFSMDFSNFSIIFDSFVFISLNASAVVSNLEKKKYIIYWKMINIFSVLWWFLTIGQCNWIRKFLLRSHHLVSILRDCGNFAIRCSYFRDYLLNHGVIFFIFFLSTFRSSGFIV